MNCDFCGKEESLPFTCNYCGGTFCPEHRLPEAHRCSADLSRRPVIATSTSTFSWGGSTFGGNLTRRHSVFSSIEIRDIVIAWVALALAFFIAQGGLFLGVNAATSFFVALVAVGTGFIFHELMHKFTAQRYGYWAEFRMWLFGLVLAFLTSMAGFIIAAPGATYIQGYNVPDRENGVISVAGPATNAVIAIGFLLLLLVRNPLLEYVSFVGLQVNLVLAAFNMIPVPPLDGSKVFRWNKLYWGGLFIPLVLGTIVVFLYLRGTGL